MRLSIPARLPSPPLLLRGRPKGLPLSGKEPNTLSDSVARMLAAPANILHEVGEHCCDQEDECKPIQAGAKHSCLAGLPLSSADHVRTHHPSSSPTNSTQPTTN